MLNSNTAEVLQPCVIIDSGWLESEQSVLFQLFYLLALWDPVVVPHLKGIWVHFQVKMLSQAKGPDFLSLEGDLLDGCEPPRVQMSQSESVIVLFISRATADHTASVRLGELYLEERLGVEILHITFFSFVGPEKDFSQTIISEVIVIRGE